MGSRLELHSKLGSITGVSNLYFQPPENKKIEYDAIVYKMDRIAGDYADNSVFRKEKRYQVTVISKDPDNSIAETILTNMKYCRFDRRYVIDNLYHDVLNIYF